MDHSKVKELCGDRTDWLIWAMQLGKWRVNMHYEPIDGKAGTCQPDPQYHIAEIDIDPAKHEDESDALDTLRHELLHIMHAPFGMYRAAVCQAVGNKTFRVLDEIYQTACEHTVSQLENMLTHGLGMDTEQMIETAKRMVEKGKAA